jgi:hypothetical protein
LAGFVRAAEKTQVGMGKIFSRGQVEGYHDNGHFLPAPALTFTEAVASLAHFENHEQRQWDRRPKKLPRFN